MKFSFKLLEKVKNQAGATAVIVAIVLPMLIGFGALAVDVGYMHVTKNELQNVADAAALAGAGYLGSIYETLTYDAQQIYVFSRSDIVAVVQQVALKNQAAKMNIHINNDTDADFDNPDADVLIGDWDSETGLTPRLTATFTLPDAVRVIARRDGSANGPILTFFARIFNIATVNVIADATAALTGPTMVGEGELKTPFSLSDNVFPDMCEDTITFSPAGSCAGWHNFFDGAAASGIADKILGIIVGDGVEEDLVTPNSDCLLQPCGRKWLDANFTEVRYIAPQTMPQVSIGDELNHSGGVISSLMTGDVLLDDVDTGGGVSGNGKKPAPMPTLFDYFRRRDDDGDDSVWTATVPVYKEVGDHPDACKNPQGSIEIVGFAIITIFEPIGPPDTSLSVNIDCRYSFLDDTRGGGGSGGYVKGTIPNLVE